VKIPKGTSYAITLEEYRRMEEAGELTRPLTAEPIGRYTAPKRATDARNSEAVTQHLEPRPAERARTGGEGAVWPPEPRKRPQGPSVAQETEIATEAS